MTNLASNTTPKKGYVFGFVQPTSPKFAKYPPLGAPTIQPFGGRLVCKQSIKAAIHAENASDYAETYVLEFPSFQKAKDWYNSDVYAEPKKLRLETSTGPLVILEGEPVGDYQGFLTAFIKVDDKENFAKYSPVESLKEYQARRIYAAIDNDKEAPLVAERTDAYHAVVLIAFPTRAHGKAWMDSDEYKEDRHLRLSSTSGPCAIIGSDEEHH